MKKIVQSGVVAATIVLLSMGHSQASSPLYSDSLEEGLETLEQNNEEYEMLLSLDSEPETEDSWIIFSASGSGCIISGCAFSGCLGSGCGGSGCFGSWCSGSGCIFSGCGGSLCGGSVCGGSGCHGSGCGGSVCYGSACGYSGCVGSVCGGSGCAGSICGGSGCGGSYCLVSVCGGTTCQGSLCAASGCELSLCATTGCGASACDDGCCAGQAAPLQVDPDVMLASIQMDSGGQLTICANFTGFYDVVYLDTTSQQRKIRMYLDAGIVSTAHMTHAKELLRVVKA